MRTLRVGLVSMAAAVAAFAVSVHAENAADPAKGRTAFIQHGCWQCHDFAGEGSVATSNGRVIARTALPLDAFISFVRTTNGQMPPYRAPVISDAELGDIYAYLQSLPESKPVNDIPLLNSDVRQK